MGLRRRTYFRHLGEGVVVVREMAHVGRALGLSGKEAKCLVGIFFSSNKVEKFDRLMSKKMPDLLKKISAPKLFKYLELVFG